MAAGTRVLALATALVLAFLAVPSHTHAQSLTGAISGTVVDASGTFNKDVRDAALLRM